MHTQTPTYDATIRLVPHSGIQFVNYAMKIDEIGRLNRHFIERPVDNVRLESGEPAFQLIASWDEENPNNGIVQSTRSTDKDYDVNERKALEVFMEKWVPIPMLRVKVDAEGRTEFDDGPTNWARIKVVEVPDRAADDPVSHHVTIAFDTELRPRRPQRPYTAPSQEDARSEHEFRFVYQYRDLTWFLGASAACTSRPPQPLGPAIPVNSAQPSPKAVRALGLGAVAAELAAPPSRDAQDDTSLAQFQQWVSAWLLELLREFKQAQHPNRALRDADFPYAFEHVARYLVFLELIARAIEPRTVRLIDTVSDMPVIKPIAVDLVLDIGNSRTCGLLIELRPNDSRVDLNNSFVLALRDLSEPERMYSEPFESQVELSQARFGRDHLSVHSGASRAFFWPSPVRVGPEALRFRQAAQGTEVVTGLSSPKRYLCDVGAVQQEWRFPERDYDPTNSGKKSNPLIDKAIRQFVNERGDVIEQLEVDRKRYGFAVRSDDRVSAQHLSFSRSSFFTLMVAEIIWQALVMINDVAVREHRSPKDAPRKLRRIILTLPPAMPVQEQRLLRSRAEGAVKLIWQLMGWWQSPPPSVFPPEVNVSLDEASCVQLVYLYGEITQKLGGSILGYMGLVGRPRPFSEPGQLPVPDAKPEPSVRVASIDIGGGTTDLMITTYYQMENVQLRPTQNFREGFRIAGDDVLKQVIERLVLPAMELALRSAGLTDPRRLLNELFGGDRANMAEQEKHLRRQFVHRVLQPIGLRMLNDAENATLAQEENEPHYQFADFFPTPRGRRQQSALPARKLLDFVEGPAKALGAEGFSMMNCEFTTDFRVIREAVDSVLGGILDNLSEVLNEFDPDVVLLSGRPSRLTGVVDLISNKLAVPPDRIVPMHLYQAGTWYPFRDRDNRRIGDPKTTTAVGAMLCALAETQLDNFALETSRMGLRSTAKFIGALDGNNHISNEKLFFKDIDLDAKATKEQSATIRYYAPMRLGFRQLPLERWTATPLYRLRFRSGLDNTQFKMPIEVTIERADNAEVDGDAPDALIKAELMKEEFRIADAQDPTGKDARPKLELFLDTVDREKGYWLDTGILSVG